MSQSNFPLTLYFDSACPLCVAEMDQLQALDNDMKLKFADILAEDFQCRYPHIDPVAADQYLHAEYADGRMIYGLDVTCAAWAAVEKKRWLSVLRWPLVRMIADLAYRFFARHRYSISWLVTGTRRCERCNMPADSRTPSDQL